MKIDLKNLVINSFYALIGDWERIYKHQKSIYPLLKSFTGTCKIPFKHFPRKSINNEFEFLTFSVLPSLTSFWLNQLSTIIKKVGFKITIGDCSGDLEKKKINYQVNIIPIMNFQHGYKLDLFIMHICKSDFIVICDDDIFFLNEEPLSWAKEELIKNKNLAVVSLFPRPSIPER